MIPFVAMGTLAGGYLLLVMIRGPIDATVASYHLAYSAPISHGLIVVSMYVAATCGALLLSRYRHVVIFGIANVIAVAVLARITIDGFASLWCAYAAVIAGAIAAHMRLAKPHRETIGAPIG
jgi:hypothetical protein